LPCAIQEQTGTVISPFASHSLRRTVATRVAESPGAQSHARDDPGA